MSAQQRGQSLIESVISEDLYALVQECLNAPHKVMMTLRFAKTDSNFVITPQKADNGLWLHGTCVRMERVPKFLYIEALVEYRNRRGGKQWTPQLIRKMDKRHGLKGVQKAVCKLGAFEFTDHIPQRCYYKPALRELIVQRMLLESARRGDDWDITISANGEDNIDATSHFQLVEFGEDGRYHKILFRGTGDTIDIPEDMFVTKTWKIETGWSIKEATLAGRRKSDNIRELFVEDGNECCCYDSVTHMDALAEKVLKLFEDEMRESRAQSTAEAAQITYSETEQIGEDTDEEMSEEGDGDLEDNGPHDRDDEDRHPDEGDGHGFLPPSRAPLTPCKGGATATPMSSEKTRGPPRPVQRPEVPGHLRGDVCVRGDAACARCDGGPAQGRDDQGGGDGEGAGALRRRRCPADA